MNFRTYGLVFVGAFSLSNCEATPDVLIPMFPDGGLIRTGTPLTRDQLMAFEGMFQVRKGSKVFGNSVAVRTST